jgi:MSHA pilin protein MshC
MDMHLTANRRTCGFTLVELIMVMVILGLLSIVVLPRLSDTSTFRSAAFRSEVVAALRHAQKSAVSHRRLVCAAVRANGVDLTIAESYGGKNCSSSLIGPDGSAVYARSADDLITSVTGTIYFQPSGTVTSNDAGTSVATYTIDVKGMTSISIVGSTGYVN